MSARSVSSIPKDSTPLSSSRLDSVLTIGAGAEADPAPAEGPLSRSVVVLKFETVDSFTKEKEVVHLFVTANSRLLWELKNVVGMNYRVFPIRGRLGQHKYTNIITCSVSPDAPLDEYTTFLSDTLANFAASDTKTLLPGEDEHDLMSFKDVRVYEDMELIALASLFTAGGLWNRYLRTPLLNVRVGRFVRR